MRIWRKRTSGSSRQVGKSFPLRPSQTKLKQNLPKVRGNTEIYFGVTGIVLHSVKDGDHPHDIYERLDSKFPDRIGAKTVMKHLSKLEDRGLIRWEKHPIKKLPIVRLTKKGELLKARSAPKFRI